MYFYLFIFNVFRYFWIFLKIYQNMGQNLGSNNDDDNDDDDENKHDDDEEGDLFLT